MNDINTRWDSDGNPQDLNHMPIAQMRDAMDSMAMELEAALETGTLAVKQLTERQEENFKLRDELSHLRSRDIWLENRNRTLIDQGHKAHATLAGEFAFMMIAIGVGMAIERYLM